MSESKEFFVPAIKSDEHVIVVHGFKSDGKRMLEIVQKTCGSENVELYQWKSEPQALVSMLLTLISTANPVLVALGGVAHLVTRNAEEWIKAKANADNEVERLTDYILSFPQEKREKLVLVGHSLGGRMIAKTLAELASKNVKIGRAILLGAAVDSQDEAVGLASNATISGIENRINPQDFVLSKIYKNFGEAISRWWNKKSTITQIPLGTTAVNLEKWKNVVVKEDSSQNHCFEYYWFCGNVPEEYLPKIEPKKDAGADGNSGGNENEKSVPEAAEVESVPAEK